MTSYYICLVIVVCCCGAILPASGCNITQKVDLMEFDLEIPEQVNNELIYHGLRNFLDNADQYEAAIKNIDQRWPTKSWSDDLAEIDQLQKLSVGLTKCQAFAAHLQCSASQSAPKFLILMKLLMKTILEKDESIIKQYVENIRKLTENLIIYLLHLISAFYELNYASPRWMTVLLIHCEDIQIKTNSIKDYIQFKNDITEYLFRTNRDITELVINLLLHCASLGISPPSYGPPSDTNLITENSYEPSKDLSKELNEQLQYLKAKNELFFGRTKGFISYRKNVFDKFRIENWLLMTPNNDTPITKSVNLNELLTRPKWDLGILWEDPRNILDKISIRKYEEYRRETKNWMINLYLGSYLSQHSGLKQIKLIYLAVVTRLVLIGVSECDRLRKQIEEFEMTKNEREDSGAKNDSKNEKMRNTFKENCSQIRNYVRVASNYVKGDEFLDNLEPELIKFGNEFGQNGPNIMVKVMEKLHSVSGFLKVNASLCYYGQETNLISDNEIDTDIFKKLMKLDQARQYTLDLKKHLPLMDFDVGNTMEMAANNNYIP